jgi:RNA polymerase sigma-70 factor (ECF subfamily)
MLYTLLCYNNEDVVWSWTKEEDDAVMNRLSVVHEKLTKEGKLGPSLRLLPTTAATTIRGAQNLGIDGPFAETKEQLLGFYVIDVPDLDAALDVARQLSAANPTSCYEIRPIALYVPESRPNAPKEMTDIAWIHGALTGARPQAVGALLRYFRDMDRAEEAFQEACLRALKSWPQNGPPRDPAAWLILVGRNAALDGVRKQSRNAELPPDEQISDLDDVETPMAERLDSSQYRDDVLRLLFVCCHPDLPATQQIALALRIVSGLTVPQIARAFLVSEAAMEQRITRAKSRVAKADIPFEAPGAVERSERLGVVAAMIYLLFNEGYSAGNDPERAHLCDEAIRLARLLLRLFQAEPEMMGLTALMLLQQARLPARFDAEGEVVLLDDQDRGLWDKRQMSEGLALIDKAMRHNRPGPYQVQAAIAAVHARAATADATDWANIDHLYAVLERMQPSPVVTLNRAVAVGKVEGPQAALDMIAPLEERLSGYFHFFGARGAFLLQLGRNEEARVDFDRAIALAGTPAEAAHIRRHLDRLKVPSRLRDGIPGEPPHGNGAAR